MAIYGKIWQNIAKYCIIWQNIAKYCKMLHIMAKYCKMLHLVSVKSRQATTISDFHCSNDQNKVIKFIFIFVLQNVLSCLKLVLLTHNTILHNNNGALCLKLIFVVCCAHPVMTKKISNVG